MSTLPDHRPGRRAWIVVGMLFLFSTINFFDKLVLGLAAVPIMKELGLTPASYGVVAGSFFWLYAVAGVVTGLFIVSRVRTKWLLVGLVAIWSLSQLPIAFTSSLTVLVICRIVLGIGEGPGTPTAFHACHSWFPSEKRNLPTAIVLQGTAFGFLIGAPILTHIIIEFGWRWAFAACSLLGFAWIVAWSILGADGPISAHNPTLDARRAPWASLWFDRTMLGNYVLGFGSYWIAGLSIAWLAPYLQLGLGYDGRTTGWLISAISATQPPLILLISFVSQRMLQRGFSSRAARATINALCLVAAGCALTLAMQVDQAVLRVPLLAIGFMLPPITFVLGPAMVSEVAPVSQRGTALLVTYSIITVAGLLSPMVVGQIVQGAALQGAGPQGACYATAFYVTSLVLVICGLVGFALLRPDASARRLAAQAVDETPGLPGLPASAS